MIGVLDSGAGGAGALVHLRSLLPTADITFLADIHNAPYGTKSADELIPLIEGNIDTLYKMGADRILIACCTASSLWHKFSDNARKIALPIIHLTADLLDAGDSRIMVISTDFTARVHAFSGAIMAKYKTVSVTEIPMQRLVMAVEQARKSIDASQIFNNSEVLTELSRLDCYIEKHRPDTLILGCTHFSWLEHEIKRRYPSLRILNPARIGAESIASEVIRKGTSKENGWVVYIVPRYRRDMICS